MSTPQLPNSSEFKPITATPIVPVGKPFPNRKKPQYACPTPDGHNNLEARSALQKEIRLCPDGTTEEETIEKLKGEVKACNEDGIDDTVLTLREQNAMY